MHLSGRTNAVRQPRPQACRANFRDAGPMRMQEASSEADWRMGAIPDSAGVTFRVWAPQARGARVLLESGAARGETQLAPHANGFFAAALPAAPGDRYRFSIDGGEALPDPASRFQPEGPH